MKKQIFKTSIFPTDPPFACHVDIYFSWFTKKVTPFFLVETELNLVSNIYLNHTIHLLSLS